MKKNNRGSSDRIGYYFRREAPLLFVVTITGIFYNLGMVAAPWFEGQMVQYLCDIFALQRPAADMLRLVLCYVFTILLVQAARFFKRLFVRKFANNISRRMKMILYRNLLFQTKSDAEDAGSMMTRIIGDADACVEGMRKFTTEIFDTGVVMIAYLAMLLSYDWKLTLLSMLFPPLAYLLAERLKGIVTRSVARSREAAGVLNETTLERISNALTYRVYGQEQNRGAVYERCLSDYEKKAVRANLWENTMQPLYQIISMFSTIPILWFGARNVLGTGWTVWNIAAFSTFFSCYRKLAVKSSKAAKLFNAVQKAQVSWKRIQPWLAPVPDPRQDTLPVPSVLSAKDLSFARTGLPALLHPFSFSAAPGEIIGVTGPVACGKSTFGKLLTGELAHKGVLSFGGRDLPEKGNPYFPFACYLGHQPELFSGTIEENICLGKPGDIFPVLHAVCMDQEVRALSDGIYTRIGDGGVRLSGGQQARIALARTLYHKKPLFILDDPFSAVDLQTEKQIFANLRLWAADCTVFLISHRLTLFPQLDQVFWMENGTVCALDHRTLLLRNKTYRSLYETWQKEVIAP